MFLCFLQMVRADIQDALPSALALNIKKALPAVDAMFRPEGFERYTRGALYLLLGAQITETDNIARLTNSNKLPRFRGKANVCMHDHSHIDCSVLTCITLRNNIRHCLAHPEAKSTLHTELKDDNKALQSRWDCVVETTKPVRPMQ